jgi:tryptophan-rich sensory protein
MESITTLAMSFAVAAAILSFFAILRIAFRSDTLPTWLTSDYVAYAVAILLTFAIASSLFYVGASLSAVANGWIAFFGTFAVHIGLVALFLAIFPRDQKQTTGQRGSSMAASEGVAA